MEKYSKAVSEMYSQFKKKEAYPMKKYVGRLARCRGGKSEVVGYSADTSGGVYLIVDASLFGGWRNLDAYDVIFKKCESYWYAGINDLID